MAYLPLSQPFTLSLAELITKSFLGTTVFAAFGVSSWILTYKFICDKDKKAFLLGLTAILSGILWMFIFVLLVWSVDPLIYAAISVAVFLITALINRRIWRGLGDIRQKERGLFRKNIVLLTVAIMTVALMITGLERGFALVHRDKADSWLEQAQEELDSQQTQALSKVEELAQDPALLNLFDEKKFEELAVYAGNALSQIEPDAVVITDERGFILAAPHDPNLIGNNLGSLESEYVRVLAGEERRFLKPGVTAPLVVGAGAPIEGKGAVFVAKQINEGFVTALAEQIKAPDLGIYALQQGSGPHASTIKSQTLDKALYSWVQLISTDKMGGEGENIIQTAKADNQAYTNAARILTDEDGDIAGVIVVSETFPNAQQNSFLLAAAVLVFLVANANFLVPFIVHDLCKR